MKKTLTSLIVAVASLYGGAWAQAPDYADASAQAMLAGEVQKAQKVQKAESFVLEQSQSLVLTPITSPTLKGQQKSAVRRSPQRVATTADAVKGFYVGTYQTLANGSYDGGSTMQIVPDAEGDSITINYFWNGQPVRAHLDKATGAVTVPSQNIYTDATLGVLYLSTVKQDGKPDAATQISGVVEADGSVNMADAWWGIFTRTKTSTAAKDALVAAYYNLVMEKPNGTFQYKRKNTDGTETQYGYYVVINQPSDNIAKVKNIFNRGLEIEMALKRDRTATITAQVGLVNGDGSYILAKVVETNEAGNLTKYNSRIVTDAAASDNNKTMTWTDWTLLNSSAGKYYGVLTDAVLTNNSGFSYPTLSVTEFKGSGTEADPYQIATRDDLILLSDKVNTDDNYTGTYYNTKFSQSFKGQYFVVVNDIDMSGYRFDPIGGPNTQRFAGTFDGQGHTIKNLEIQTEGSEYVGLFGIADTTAVLKNVVFDNAVIRSAYGSTGAMVGKCDGVVSGITVRNSDIQNVYILAGAVVGGTCNPVVDCHAENTLVAGNSCVGGVVGEATAGVRDCSATDMTVFITGTTWPCGGVVGNLVSGDGENLYFSGLVSTYNQSGAQEIGGIAGRVGACTLRNSFGTGYVYGAANETLIGGVTARLRGNVENCYFNGRVHCFTRKGGGLVGSMARYTLSTTGAEYYYQPEVHNAYSASSVEVETYQYDRTRCAELFGEIVAGTEPVLENVYYDKQMTNFYSEKYGMRTSEMTKAGGLPGFPADKWVFTEGAYPRLKTFAETEAAKMSASAILMDVTDNFGKLSHNTRLTALGNTKFYLGKNKAVNTYNNPILSLNPDELGETGFYSEVKNGMLNIKEDFGVDTLYVVNGNTRTFHFISIAPIPFEGAGTADDPFILRTKADMIALANATSIKKQNFADLYFSMANDIDMELDESFEGISAVAKEPHAKFQGVFDGCGHTIDRLTVRNRVVWKTEPAEGQLGSLNTTNCEGWSGLFGRVGENGVVKNLTIGANSKLVMFATCAAFVGANDGHIENCRNYADVTGYSCWVGGITGQNGKTGVITNCYNAGNITTSYNNVGGIAGSTNGIIENCVNTGTIRATQIVTDFAKTRNRAGGLFGGGSGTLVRNSINYGDVYADLTQAGGIAGSFSKPSATQGVAMNVMENVINTGSVFCAGTATTGAISGEGGSFNYTNVFYDGQNIPVQAVANGAMTGVTGATTAFLTSGNAIEGFDPEVWEFAAGKYPALKARADEAAVAAARDTYLTFPEGISAGDFVSGSAKFSANAVWTLKEGTAFTRSISGVNAPATIEDVLTDQAIAVNKAGNTHTIQLIANPAMPLAGAGTEEDPYKVNNLDDWKSLCEWVNKTNKNLFGKFVKATADIDFASTKTLSLGGNGVTIFDGSFDGGGHTFKNLSLTTSATKVGAIFGTIGVNGSLSNTVFEGTMKPAHNFAAPIVDNLYGAMKNVTSKVAVSTAKNNTSGMVLYAHGGATFENVNFEGTVSSTDINMAGIVLQSVDGPVTFKDCAFRGKITYAPTKALTAAKAVNTGGFGSALLGATFDNCVSDGEIVMDDAYWATGVAGFIGSAPGHANAPEYLFTNCVNRTAITAGGKIAGFIAVAPGSANGITCRYQFFDCVNEGDISALSTKAISSAPTAGFTCYYTPNGKYVRCVNKGIIISSKNVYAAGIAGSYSGYGTEEAPVEFTDCRNEGDIIADGNQGGGITGYCNNFVTMTRCSNSGNIEATGMVGGLTSGFGGTKPHIINCYNTGNVTSKTYRAGGLVAWDSPSNNSGIIEGSWNAGDVSSQSETGDLKNTSGYAIGGIAGHSGAIIRDCANFGTITGAAHVGGIVGEPSRNSTKIYSSYNTGKIVAPADTCGNIIGIHLVDNGKNWSADNVLESCYYLAGNETTSGIDAGVDGAKLISRAELAKLDLGEGFASHDDFTYPVAKGLSDHDLTLFHAADLILGEGDSESNVTKNFNVGGTPAVTWTTDCASLAFEGNKAVFKSDFNGAFTVRATAAGKSKTFSLIAVNASGVNDLESVNDVVSAIYYTTAGVEVAKPVVADGQVYIVVEKLLDGTTRVRKAVNK